MHNIINLQFICAKCPNGMNKNNCPVNKYIDQESELFHKSINESVVCLDKPYIQERARYESALMRMQEICQECQKQRN